jgi:hypothetical protein
MSKPLVCYLGFHAWHQMVTEPGFPMIECLRCGKQEAPARNVMIRTGWDQHMNG